MARPALTQRSETSSAFLPAELANDPDLLATVVSLIEEAGEPYSAWFFGSAEQARATLADWLKRPTAEVSAERLDLVHENGNGLAGLFIGVPGADLDRCRKSDLLVAVASTQDAEAKSALADRIRQTRDLFLEVGEDEYYLSKMAVTRERRGRGFGRLVLEAFLNKGRAHGYERFSLDVSADNAAAVKLYALAGFRVKESRERAGMRYFRMILNRLAFVLLPLTKGFECLPAVY